MTIPPALVALGAVILVAAALYAIRIYTDAREEIARLKRLNEAMNGRKT